MTVAAPDAPEGEGLACSHCARSFEDQNALYSHTRAKHGRRAAEAVRPPRDSDDDPSIAAELVDAIQAARAGERVPEHLYTMFRESFPRNTKVMPLSEYTKEIYGPWQPTPPSKAMIAKRERYQARKAARRATAAETRGGRDDGK